MMRSLLTAATGMEAQQLNIDTVSNNIANVNTTAFKRSRANFHDLLYQTLKAPGLSASTGAVVPGGIQIGTGAKLSSVDKMFTEGAVKITGNELDFMVEGRGFFRVQRDDGEVLYTRDGHFSKDSTGRLVNSEGYPVLPEIVVPQDAQNLHVGSDGTVSVKVAGQDQQIGQILIADFINPSGLISMGGNNYMPSRASGDPVIGTPTQNSLGQIAQNQLESSNVNIVEEMVNMITGQRAYEINSKVIQTGDQMLSSTVNIR